MKSNKIILCFILGFIFTLDTTFELYAQTAGPHAIMYEGNVIQVILPEPVPVAWGQALDYQGTGNDEDKTEHSSEIKHKTDNRLSSAGAVNICKQSDAHGYNDWRLPTLDELNVLFQNRSLFTGFHQGNYWSSCGSNHQFAAYVINFPSGYQILQPKDKPAFVCCIRKPTKIEQLQLSYAIAPDQPLSFIYPQLKPLRITDDSMNELSLYSIQLDTEKDKRCGIDELASFNIRKNAYKRVLRKMALQHEFEIGNLSSYRCAIQQMRTFLDTELVNTILNTAVFTSDFFYSLQGDAINDVKIATTCLNILKNTVKVTDDAAYLAAYMTLLNAAKLERAKLRIEHLRSKQMIDDAAFTQALEEVFVEINNLPDAFWRQLYLSLQNNREKLVSGAVSLAKIISDVAGLIGYNPVRNWIEAGLTTLEGMNTAAMRKTALKELTLIATIYMTLLEQNKNTTDDMDIDLLDYAQLFYLDKLRFLITKNEAGEFEYFSKAIQSSAVDHEIDYQLFFNALSEKRLLKVKGELLVDSP